ncbi:MAG: hypothetical protein JNK14_07585 [Chitinophagaceae bacterium]|nr:hypothetical protein [Chitinophagaceae bacterium]
MMKKSFILLSGMISFIAAFGQSGEAPNYANSALLPPGSAQASKLGSDINIFTGQPNLSVPIYSYKSNSGLSLNISLDYTGGGGIQVSESPSYTGLGWYLSSGGVITRTVKGMPDDMATYGFLYAGAIPADFRSNGSKYYYDSLDSQQDVFSFNFPGHSGRFFIGKNGQIAVAPLAKIKVIPSYHTDQTLKSFRVVTEDGVKYDFDFKESTNIDIYNPYTYTHAPFGYYNVSHGTAWYLSRIVSAFNTDTIKFSYETRSVNYTWQAPQVTFVNNANGSRKTPVFNVGGTSSNLYKPLAVEFPDKTTVSFIYSNDYLYDDEDYALAKIKISDTAFRFGYNLNYQVSYVSGHDNVRSGSYPVYDSTRLLLKSITPYTKRQVSESYYFDYNYPLFPRLGAYDDTIHNQKDHWGFMNSRPNGDTSIPQVNGYSWGANRNPAGSAIANSLYRVYLPTGGYTTYQYELNTHYPYIKQNNSVTIAPATNSQNTVSFNQVYNPKHQLIFLLDKSVSRTGSAPISGSGSLNVYIKNTSGTVTYRSTAISLYDLFYQGIKTWTFNLPDGSYRLETSLAGGTSITGSFPVDIKWENKATDTTQLYNYSGGIRIKSISRYADINDEYEASFEEYNYVTENGRSSGFLGDIPLYDYPYREVVITGTWPFQQTTTTDYTVVTSQPVAPMDYTQGSPVGYNRVEVSTKSTAGNLGKTVYEFTGLADVNSNVFTVAFPYIPYDLRHWGIGMPKRISVYDSSGILVQRTVNTYQYDSIEYNNDNFKSLKLGHSQTTYHGDPNSGSTPKTKTFIGENFYPGNGRAYLTYTTDSLFQSNGTINARWQQMEYDTNYNVTKVITSYDRTRGLQAEQRMYYPYNYTVGGTVGKLRDSAIITIPVATETWITGDGNPRITGGAVTTYKQIASGSIKPDSIYSFESNKPVAQATITVFDPAKLNRNPTYFKAQNHFVSYDAKGNLSEAKNIVTGQSSSVITDYDQQYVIAKVSNAAQADIAYTSFESAGTGNWTVNSTSRDLTDKMTGKKSYNLSSGTITKSGLSSGKQYLLTVWAKSTASAIVNSNPLSNPVASQQGWNLFSVNLAGITSVTVSGSGLVDELRLHPKDANMVTNTYDPLIGITSTTDANNTVAYTEYDFMNRPMLIRDKDRNIVKRFQYTDSAMLINIDPDWEFQGVFCRTHTSIPLSDSLFIDTNPNSDSYGQGLLIQLPGYDCSCPGASAPQYKLVNGVCELGVWSVVSSVKINKTTWQCTWRYCFSDGSFSMYSETTTGSSSCTITCTML